MGMSETLVGSSAGTISSCRHKNAHDVQGSNMGGKELNVLVFISSFLPMSCRDSKFSKGSPAKIFRNIYLELCIVYF